MQKNFSSISIIIWMLDLLSQFQYNLVSSIKFFTIKDLENALTIIEKRSFSCKV